MSRRALRLAHVVSAIVLVCQPIAFCRADEQAEQYVLQTSDERLETRVDVSMEVGGELKVSEKGKERPLKMSVVGRLAYAEKRLESGDGGPRTVRYYDAAEAVIKIENQTLKPTLHADRRLIVCAAGQPETILFSPLACLTREELDLVDVPANSMLLDGLLPDRAVAVGDRWEHAEQLLTGLLGLDAVSQTDVASELKKVEGSAVRMELTGKVQGAVGGVSTEIELMGKYTFDLEAKQISSLALLIKERRSIGHAAPGLDVVAKVQVRRAAGESSPRLVDEELAGLILDPQPELLELAYISATGKFRFQYDRRWQVLDEQRDVVALRMVDRGELIAQCNVSSLPKAPEGEAPSLPRFQDDVERSLGKNFGEFLTAAQGTTPAGYMISRVVAAGTVAELPIHWHYYLVAEPSGQRAVLAFTVEADLEDRLGDLDQQLAGSLELTQQDPTAQPTPATAPTEADNKGQAAAPQKASRNRIRPNRR